MLDIENYSLHRRAQECIKKYLVSRGYTILAMDWKGLETKADMIAIDNNSDDNGALVFIEACVSPIGEREFENNAVNNRKAWEGLALDYLDYVTKRHEDDVADMPVRFDIVSLAPFSADRGLIRHHFNAFAALG